MTAHADQERADFLAWLRIKPCGAAHDFAWEAWKAARRAPAAPVPQFSRIAQKKLDYLLEAGEAITGYAIENKDGRRGAIDCHGFVYWWQDAAAPVPQGWKLVPVELLELIQESLGSFVSDQGWSQSDMDTADALDGLLAAAPQQPEAGCSVSNGETQAAPVQLPEPAGWIDDGGMVFWSDGRKPNDGEIIYTEQQVRDLLAAHGIQEQST